MRLPRLLQAGRHGAHAYLRKATKQPSEQKAASFDLASNIFLFSSGRSSLTRIVQIPRRPKDTRGRIFRHWALGRQGRGFLLNRIRLRSGRIFLRPLSSAHYIYAPSGLRRLSSPRYSPTCASVRLRAENEGGMTAAPSATISIKYNKSSALSSRSARACTRQFTCPIE